MKCTTTLFIISFGLLVAFQQSFCSNVTESDDGDEFISGLQEVSETDSLIPKSEEEKLADKLESNEVSNEIDTGVSAVTSEAPKLLSPTSEEPKTESEIVENVKDVMKTYDIFFSDGVKAYLDENWEGCIKSMKAALEDNKFYQSIQSECRLKCTGAEEISPLVPASLPMMQFFEKLIRQTHCLLKCKKNVLKNRPEIVAHQVNRDFESLVPYDYLQLCYFKLNDLQNGASAAYTFLIQNPDHQVMKENLRFYLTLPSVDESAVVNLEAKPYVEAYVRGTQAYRDEDYSRCVSYMEESLENYLKSEEECRALCEGPFDQGWFPDFVSSVANHFTFTLRCKLRCPEKLKNVNGQIYDDLIASHYHYLQFSYFQIGETRKACEAAGSYLSFFPNDSTMLGNRDFYLKQDGVDETWFQARPEALKYLERLGAERNLLSYIEHSFQFDEEEISEPVTAAPQEPSDT